MSNKLPPIPYGSPPGSSYWNDWYEKMRTIINGVTGSFVASFNGRTGAVSLTSGDVTGALGYTPGTVTSVAATVPSIFSISGSPITTSGTLAITYSGLALPVLNGGTGATTSTGTGSVVLSNSPTLVTPALGTPSSVTLTNATELPISTGVSGLGTGIATFLATPSSANLAAALTDETGTGAAVFASSPALVGVPTAPTAVTGTNTTQLATTAFVNNVVTGPSFAAWQSTAQSIPDNVTTKIQFQSEEWDTAAAFDSAVNYRFTPQIAGYYQVNGNYQSAADINGRMSVAVYKNGSVWKFGNQAITNATRACTISTLVFLNGSTDYVELFAFQASGVAVNTQNSQQSTWFQAHLARAA